MPACVESKFDVAFLLNRRVDLRAIDATPARWRGDSGSSSLDRARTAASSPRNEHPTDWLISTQVPAVPRRLRGPLRERQAWPPPADARRMPQPVPRRVLRDVRAVHVHDPRCVSNYRTITQLVLIMRRPIARHSFPAGMRARLPRQETRRERRLLASPPRARPGWQFGAVRRRRLLSR